MSPSLPLHQYWHDGAPPADVAATISGWAGDPAFRHRLWDRDDARLLILGRHGAALAAAFDACAVPAMQADLFRYAVLEAQGGVYLDADIARRGDLASRLSPGRGTLMRRGARIANDVLHLARPGDPLMAWTLSAAAKNVAARRQGSIWWLTGPGLLTGRFHDSPGRAGFAGLAILSAVGLGGVLGFEWGLAYKRGALDWRQTEKRGGRIYAAPVQEGGSSAR